jgi:2-dehydropantoate 2-reductase
MTMANGVHVLGAGSLGCLVGALCLQARLPVTLLLRSEQRLQTFREKGSQLTLECHRDAHVCMERISCPAESIVNRSLGSSHHIQRLIVATKAQHTVSALSSIQHRLTPSSSVLLLQNGALAVMQAIARDLYPPSAPRPAFFVASVTHGAFCRSDYHVVHAGMGGIAIGSLPDGQPSNAQQQQQQVKLQSLVNLLSAAKALNVTAITDPQEVRRSLLVKLASNCCINPLTALYNHSNGALLGSTSLMSLVAAICDEMVATFGEQLRMDSQQLQRQVEGVIQATAHNRSSMLQDVCNLNGTEIDFLTGYLVAEASKRQISVPVSQLLLTMVKAKEELMDTPDSSS